MSPLPALLITSCIPWDWLQCVFIQRCNKYWGERGCGAKTYSLQQRPGHRTRNRPFSFTIHSTMEKFLHDMCGCATPPAPPEQPSWYVRSASRWEHTWTASQPHAAVCRWKTHQQLWLSSMGRWRRAGQRNTRVRMHRQPGGRDCTERRVRWTKDQLVVKYEQPACGLSVKGRQEWRRNVYSPQQTQAWIMHKSSKVLRTTVEPLFWNVNSAAGTTFLCSTSSLFDALAGVCGICTRRDKQYQYKTK